jgi:adenosylcobinamide-GDP ribazoletransferase
MLEIKRFFIALGYFTRLPIPASVGWSATELNRATRYFPLVGMLVGAFGAAILWLGVQCLPRGVAVVLSMLATLIVTGAFHEDGLADSADGFGGGWEKPQILAIMKDSRIGSYGAIALIVALLLKFSLLAGLGNSALLALPVVHALSRVPPLLIMGRMRYVREDDSTRAKPVAEGLKPIEWLGGSALGVLPLLIATLAGGFGMTRALLLFGLLGVAGGVCAGYLRQRIGGYTGDALGAVQQVCELTGYLALSLHLAA